MTVWGVDPDQKHDFVDYVDYDEKKAEADIMVCAMNLTVEKQGYFNNERLSGNKPLLAQHQNGYCIFWDKLCTIHPVKPKMCKQWPFIESLLVDMINWQAMASMCPGIRTDLPDRLVRDIVNTVLSKKG